MGLARSIGKDIWRLDPAFEESLRATQKTLDRQKMMTAHGVLSSDKALPFRKLKIADIQDVEGRILVHGQEEQGNGIRNYMLLESVTGEILQVPHTSEMGRMRGRGLLEPGEYVRLQKISPEGSPLRFSAEGLGDANALVTDLDFLRKNAERLDRALPQQYGGWLGQMRKAVSAELRSAELAR
jgi:hypothetical protein